jgi:hypothetical protein
MSHDVPCEVHYSGSEQTGEGSYAKAHILSDEPEIQTARKKIDDALQEAISKVDKDGAVFC